jgi:predicted anti-sigma-YlaC factor YlaD
MKNDHPAPEELLDYLRGVLSPPRDAALHQHLAQCDECSAAYEQEAGLTDLIRAHAQREEREAPPDLADAVRARIASAAGPTLLERLAAVLRPAVLVPATAIVLLVGVYLGLTIRHADATTIDASYYLDDHAALASSEPFGEPEAIPEALTDDATHDDDRWLAPGAQAGDASH